MGTIAAATSKQAKVIAFDTVEPDCILQRMAAVGTCEHIYIVHNLSPSQGNTSDNRLSNEETAPAAFRFQLADSEGR